MSHLIFNFLLILSATYAAPQDNQHPQDSSTPAETSLPQQPQRRQQQQLPSNFRPAKQINEDKSTHSANEKEEMITRIEALRRLQQAESPRANFPSANDSQSDSSGTGATAQLPPVDKSVDLDGDGVLSLAEVQYAAFVHHGLSSSVIESLFNEVDKNGDGYLTSIEFNDIRPLVLAKAESAALRYLQIVDKDRNGLLSLQEAQEYILKEYGIGNRDVERVWNLVVPNINIEMDAIMFSKLRRRIRAMSIRLARLIMKKADTNEDGHIDKREAQKIAFEQEGISAGDVNEMVMSVDDNNDGELNAPEFADFQRIIRSRAIDTSKKALKVVDRDGSGTVTMNEAKRIAFDHYGFNEKILEPSFAQADENEDGQLDAVEFAGFRSLIRSKAVKNALDLMQEIDSDGDGYINNSEAVAMARRQDDMEPKETFDLFIMADQDKSGKLDKVELADFLRLVRLSAIKFATDHFKEFDINKDKTVTVDELEQLIELKYKVGRQITRQLFKKVDVDNSGDLAPGELVDFRHEVRRFVTERNSQRSSKSNNQDAARGNIEEATNKEHKEDIQKQQATVTKSPEAEISAGKKKESLKESMATDLLSAMTTTMSMVMMQSINQLQQFTAQEKMQSQQPETDTTNDTDVTSIDANSNNESMAHDDDNEKGTGQDSAPTNEKNDKREFESAMIDVTTIEAIESVQSELESKSQSVQIQQQQQKQQKQQQGESEIDLKQYEVESETNMAVVDDMMAGEIDEDMEEQVSDNASVTLPEAKMTTKKMMEEVHKSKSMTEESKIEMADDQ